MAHRLESTLVVCGCALALAGCVRVIDLGPHDATDGGVDSDRSTPPPTACRATSGFGDDFDDGTLGEAWYMMSSGNGRLDEQAGTLSAKPAPGAGSGASATTRAAFDLRGSEVTVEVVSALAPSPLGWVHLQLGTPSDDRLRLYAQDGVLAAAYMPSGQTFTELSAVAYRADQQRWWRIRELDGAIYWETSADGAGWTTLATARVGFAVDWVHVQLEAATSGAAGDLGQAVFDHLNAGAARHDGSYQPCPLRTISDDFEDGRRSGLWGTARLDPGATAEERGGHLVLTPPAQAAGRGFYATLNPFDVRGEAATIRVARMLDTAGAAHAELRLADAQDRTAALVQQGGELRCIAGVAGAEQQLGQVSYDPARHGWWRLREASGAISCETSADGVAFDLVGSGPVTIDTSAAFVQLRALTDAPVAAPGSFEIAGFNPN